MSFKRKMIVAAGALACAAILNATMSQKETLLSSDALSGVVANPPAPSEKLSQTGSAQSMPTRRAASVAMAKSFDVSPVQKATLQAYAKIRRKVFLSDADKNEKAKLLRNRAFITSLVALVTSSTAGNAEAGELQNSALDLLYDALSGEAKATARQVLMQVASDAQIENKDIALKDRENLAGVKAEALYEWSARDPSAAAQISAAVPGPVTQQLWQNVQARQDRNVAESAGESSTRK